MEAHLETHLEALGPERFQRFCQSLLSYEKPDIQALEVGMPDGGRDAVSFGREDEADEYAVLQAKFVRHPAPLKDPLAWIEKIVKGELPKIELLVARGATSYQLMTNAIGTTHLDGGSVDKVATYLKETLPISTSCWWRADLLARIPKHPELRWGYPELLSAADILKELVESGLNEEARRRTLAIRSFIASQYEAERTVRFKQVDLQNDLLSLFVDVPVETAYSEDRSRDQARRFVEELARRESEELFATPPIGAARVLLHEDAQRAMTRVVVEGAPGQGKSTLGQYVSQIHRMRLLKKKTALRKIPAEYLRSAARLPFKIDLRDFAVFLRENGGDSFASEPEWRTLPDDWPRSLEGFLAASVRLTSGGARFDVSDLLAVAEASHLLLVLDGLDEVAEIEDRKRVVDAILRGCTRLEEIALGLQVVVTSRPIAFTKSPPLADESFLYIGLASLTTELAAEYSSKWAAARGLDGADTKGVERALMSQLGKPHIRDLSRNPMQLAILLALILNKGKALPEKRTALYTGYMDIFFDREAAKDSIVREHRETLFALHSQLGWRLHAEAEKSSAGGTISEEELKREVERFLEQQGEEDPSLVDKYFRGVVDRIFALVSPRLGGKFEFEVQPVREYFAAHYLYSTAQISRLGHERPGTLPERFDGLARNSYWLNVIRFYAGFYDIGQLPSLVDRLEDLATDEVFAPTDRAWSLAATLLSDWSFSLARASRERAIALALADLGRRHVLTQRSSSLLREPVPLILPKGSGLEELNERCWELLKGNLPADRRRAILGLLNALPHGQTLPPILRRLRESRGDKRTRWLQLASGLRAIATLEEAELSFIWDDDHEAHLGARAAALIDAGFPSLVENDEERSLALVRGLVDGRLACAGNAERPSWLGQLVALFLEHRGLFRLDRAASEQFSLLLLRPPTPLSPTAERAKQCVLPFAELPERNWTYTRSDSLWDDLVEESRSSWGDGWGLARLALELVGVDRRPESAGKAVELADASAPLLRRLRHARTRGGGKAGAWWLEQLDSAASDLDRRVVLVAAAAWPSGAALEQVLPALERELKATKEDTLAELCTVVRRLSQFRGVGRAPSFERETVDSLSLKLTAVLANRDPKTFGAEAFESRLRDYDGSSKAVLTLCLRAAITSLLDDEDAEEDLLDVAHGAYKVLGDYRTGSSRAYQVRSYEGPPLALAREVLADLEAFPLALVEAAEGRCSAEARKSVPPLLSVARKESWFAE